MEKEVFLQNLWDGDRNDSNELISLEEANSYLDELRRDENEVPEDLTAEELVEFWNDNVLTKCEWVVLPNGGRRVPRWCAMSYEQIARTIYDACSWGDVDDLCEYVLDNFVRVDDDEETNPYAMEDARRAILKWCDDNL